MGSLGSNNSERVVFGLFKKSRAVRRLDVYCPAELTPQPGLLMIQATLQAPAAEAATLRLFLDGAELPTAEKPIRAGEKAWVALHGHLLANGEHRARLEARAEGGALLAERSLKLKVRNDGPLAAQVADSLRRRGVPLAVEGDCDSRLYDYADPALVAWFDRAPDEVEAHLGELSRSGRATQDEISALRHFVDNGFLLIPGAVADEHLGRLNAALDDAVRRGVQGYEWGSSQRIQHLHKDYAAVRELWTHPTILRMLALIFDEPAIPCQTLTYVFGSQQEHHQDTVHLTPFPAGRMCGVWTALEDVQPQSGELMVFPGSHRLPRVYMDSVGAAKVKDDDWSEFQAKVIGRWTDLINEARLARTPYRPKAGDVLIWHENLMHAGAPREDLSRSRRSIVGHYFSSSAIAYYDSSGEPGHLHADVVATSR